MLTAVRRQPLSNRVAAQKKMFESATTRLNSPEEKTAQDLSQGCGPNSGWFDWMCMLLPTKHPFNNRLHSAERPLLSADSLNSLTLASQEY
jgi:hypothetical protein